VAYKRLKDRYLQDIRPALKQKLEIKNINAVPKIDKITVNLGMGKILAGSKDYGYFEEGLATITGQKPTLRRAKKAISNFKLRAGMPVGLKVTLRGQRMYDFLDKLINIVLPRVRDFRGLPANAFDGMGNYTLGLREHTVFPEIDLEDVNKVHGLQITIVTTAENDEQSKALLEEIGFPFKKTSK